MRQQISYVAQSCTLQATFADIRLSSTDALNPLGGLRLGKFPAFQQLEYWYIVCIGYSMCSKSRNHQLAVPELTLQTTL